MVEVIVADGGSSDATLEIASNFGARILHNPLRTGEAGKAVGAGVSSHEIIAFIDSDNVLPTGDWLLTMTQPFVEEEIAASEPLYYSYRKEDALITRYCALLGMNDILCMYFGNYDRYCVLTGKWTSVRPKSVSDRGNYIMVEFSAREIPTMGANGFLIRRDVLDSIGFGQYLFDIDMVVQMIRQGHTRVAKVKVGIVHLFAKDGRTYIRKTWRRMKDYLHHRRLGQRNYPWDAINRGGLQKFILFSLFLPLTGRDVVKGYRRMPDRAWLFHPAANWITFVIYGLVYILHPLGAWTPRELQTHS